MRMNCPPLLRFLLLVACLWTWTSDFLPSSSQSLLFVSAATDDDDDPDQVGPRALAQGHSLFGEGHYDEAALAYWKSILFHTQTPTHLKYDLNAAFSKFMECYIIQGKPAEGLAFASHESFRRNQHEMGHQFLQQAQGVDPNNAAVLEVQRIYVDKTQKPVSSTTATKIQQVQSTSPLDTSNPQASSTTTTNNAIDPNNPLVQSHTPEELYEIGSRHFSDRNYEECADVFELSCQLSKETLGPSCANAIYCRTMIIDWGWNGTQFERDMQFIQELTWSEMLQYRFHGTSPAHPDADKQTTPIHRLPTIDEQALIPYMQGNADFQWNRATSVHPHMMLGYPVSPLLKRFVAEAVAYMDEMMARAAHSTTGRDLPPLPPDLPFQYNPVDYATTSQNKIRVGFVGSGFNSKAVLYLSHDMFRFFDRDQFEIHIFSFGPPDNPLFIQHGMRGVDWRKRVQSNVHAFHDCQRFTNNHVQAARYIRQQDIHILIEWDGYARQGERAQGVFKLRPAPMQMLHQEYLGTSGATTHYVDYLFTDQTTTPLEQVEHLYTEKLIFLPNHFFSKGHAFQSEVIPPSHDYRPKITKEYRAGTGTPQQNKCLANNNHDKEVSFVFCNWNKLLKNNPETVRSWISILRRVPNSILCLLENPSEGEDYFRKFVHEAAGTVDQAKMDAEGGAPWEAFVPGDGDTLNDRIFFLPWEKNPFDHQHRNVDFCNAMLDSWPYNGHTVAQDALYAGVPIVTRSDGLDMSSRVTTSANQVLGLPHLNAWKGPSEYEAIAVELATNTTLYQETRRHLIDTALQRNPLHPYWDVGRYVQNFQEGLRLAWQGFVDGRPPEHIIVREPSDVEMGTMDEIIAANPPEGPYRDNYVIPSE